MCLADGVFELYTLHHLSAMAARLYQGTQTQNRTIIGTRAAGECYRFFSIAGITGICGVIIPGRSIIGAAARTDLCGTSVFLNRRSLRQ